MTTRLVHDDWGKELTDAASADRGRLRIICPFIKLGALDDLLRVKPREIEVITRFSLRDFAAGVSDLSALQRLLDRNARVRGIRHLHSKLYLFGDSRAAITSANLTRAAMGRNSELGIMTGDPGTIAQCHDYFEGLWRRGKSDLEPDRVWSWQEKVTRSRMKHGRDPLAGDLGDYGADAGLPVQSGAAEPTAFETAEQAFVKFLGSAALRLPGDTEVLEEIRDSGCHRVMTYPRNKRPRSVRDGDTIFAGRMIEKPNDIRIFGRGTAMAYAEGRDDASDDEIRARPFKTGYPHYIRVHDIKFINGKLEDGISLNALMDELGAASFMTTQRHVAEGHGNTEPRRAYGQQAAVQLTPEAQVWLNDRLEAAFARYGHIPHGKLDGID